VTPRRSCFILRIALQQFHRTSRWRIADKRSSKRCYDANNNRTSLRRRDGQTISYPYDFLNRAYHQTEPVAANCVTYGDCWMAG
jgi:hypothetical protein